MLNGRYSVPRESPKVVQSWVDLTFSNESVNIKYFVPFFILKTYPVLIGAGNNFIVTFLPE